MLWCCERLCQCCREWAARPNIDSVFLDAETDAVKLGSNAIAAKGTEKGVMYAGSIIHSRLGKTNS